MEKNKVLIICGPTATGKTNLALRLAEKFNGDIIAADSRQVYKGMDIITGKDLPENSKLSLSGYWETQVGVRIWLTDIVEPKEDFSVAQWRSLAVSTIKQLLKEGKLPIIVGGTGLYLKSLTSAIETIDIPRNEVLRSKLKDKKAEELFSSLLKLDARKAKQMNFSDKQNPRRLIRAIEVAVFLTKNKEMKKRESLDDIDFLQIGLTCPFAVLEEKIDERIKKRLAQGALDEIKRLRLESINSSFQLRAGLGYRELADYLDGKLALDEAIIKWKQEELKYAKRQMVWFKKDKDIVWFEINDNLFEKVANWVSSWYNTGK